MLSLKCKHQVYTAYAGQQFEANITKRATLLLSYQKLCSPNSQSLTFVLSNKVLSTLYYMCMLEVEARAELFNQNKVRVNQSVGKQRVGTWAKFET